MGSYHLPIVKEYAGKYKITRRYEYQQGEFDQTDEHLVYSNQYHQDDNAHGQVLWKSIKTEMLQWQCGTNGYIIFDGPLKCVIRLLR